MTGKRVAIITGATKGIGLGLAEKMFAQGAAVASVYNRDDEAAASLVRKAEQRLQVRYWA